jgi:hypothetical protein
MIITESGRRYMRIPYGCDHELWDKMNMIERLQYLGVLDLSTKSVDPSEFVRFNPYTDPLTLILRKVFNSLGLPVEMAASALSNRAFSEARQIYCLRARVETKASLAQIGELIGRDHSCVYRNINIAINVKQVREIYESIYGEAKIEEATMGEPATVAQANAAKSTNGILPRCSLDQEKQGIPERASIMQ